MTYFNVVINHRDNTFRIEESSNKPKKAGSAKSTLKKMKQVLEDNMTYSTTHPKDRYANYSTKQLDKLFQRKAEQIKNGYVRKYQDTLLPLFGDHRKKINVLRDKILTHTSFSEPLEREAYTHRRGLEKELKQFFENGLLPKRYLVRSGKEIDIEQTLEKLNTHGFVKLLEGLVHPRTVKHPSRLEMMLVSKAREAFSKNPPQKQDFHKLSVSLLLNSIANNHLKETQQLIHDYGVAGTKQGYPLHYALRVGNDYNTPKVLKRVIELGADVNQEMVTRHGVLVKPLDYAIAFGEGWDNVKLLIDQGALIKRENLADIENALDCPVSIKQAALAAWNTQR